MSHRINSSMDSEVVEQTSKHLRIAAVSSTGSGELFENFAAAIVASEATLEGALAEAMTLYVDRHPVS